MNYDQNDIANMALCVWKESRGEGQLGMQAVAHVIKNRANTWEGNVTSPLHNVIYQKNQFTSMSVSSDPEFNLEPNPNDPQYVYALSMCAQVMAGTLPDITNGALYYAYLKASTSGWFTEHISGPDGKGTPEHPLLATVGRQSFYK
jgi:spore germination cell wall hydrolase CwlJ-like protein